MTGNSGGQLPLFLSVKESLLLPWLSSMIPFFPISAQASSQHSNVLKLFQKEGTGIPHRRQTFQLYIYDIDCRFAREIP